MGLLFIRFDESGAPCSLTKEQQSQEIWGIFFFQSVSLLCLLISTSQLRWREGLKSWRYPRLKCVEINGNTPEMRTVFILVAISWKDIFSDCLSAYWIFHFPILKRPHFTDKIREYQIEFFTWFIYSLVIFEIFTKQGFERRKRLLGIFARTEFHVLAYIPK